MCSSSFSVLGVISLVENIPFVIYNIHRKENKYEDRVLRRCNGEETCH